ncbi:MAG: glutaredoxin family protein [Pseudomonadales bacterium]|nr:glutaredoxin family protein [Pseudomonadales bacterium]
MSSSLRVLTLYSTSACHLCEQAISLLSNIPEVSEFKVVIQDISESVELVERFGLRIPVVQADSTACDLGWPFNEEDVKQYLASIGLT